MVSTLCRVVFGQWDSREWFYASLILAGVYIFKCAFVYLSVYLCTTVMPLKHIPVETWEMSKSKNKRLQQAYVLETTCQGRKTCDKERWSCYKEPMGLTYKKMIEFHSSILRLLATFYCYSGEAIEITFNFLYNPRIQSKLPRQMSRLGPW